MSHSSSQEASSATLESSESKLLQALSNLTHAGLSGEQDLLTLITESAVKALIPEGTVSIHIYQPDLNALKVVANAGAHPEYMNSTTSPGEGIVGRCYQTLKTIYIDDYSKWEEASEAFKDQLTHIIALPLRDADTFFGVVTVSDDSPFHAGDIALWEMFVAHASLIVSHSRYIKVANSNSKHARELLHLSRVTQSPVVAIQEVLRDLLEQATPLIPFDYALLAAHRADELTYYAVLGFDNTQHDLTTFVTAAAVQPLTATRTKNTQQSTINFWQQLLASTETPISDGFTCHIDLPDHANTSIDSAVITFAAKAHTTFTDEHRLLGDRLGRQAASVLHLASLYQAEYINQQRKDVLLEIARTLVTSGDQFAILRDILERMGTVIQFATGSVALFEDGKVSEYIPSSQFSQYNPGRTSDDVRAFLKDSPLVKRVQQSGEPIIIPAVNEHPDWIEPEYNAYVRSWMGIPLIVNGKTLGIMMLDGNQEHAYTENDLELAEAIGAHVSVVLNNLRLYEVERKAKDQAEVLREVAAALNTSLRTEEILVGIMEAAERFIPYSTSAIAIFKPDDSIVIKQITLSEAQREVSTSAYWLVENLPEHIRLVHTQQRPVLGQLNAGRSWFGIPLFADQRLTGVFYFENTGAYQYSNAEVQMAQVLAEHAISAIRNAARYEGEQETKRKLATMLAMANTVSATLNLDAVLTRIMALAADIIPYTSSTAWLYIDDEIIVRKFGVGNHTQEQFADAHNHQAEVLPLIEQMFETGKPVIVNNTRTSPDWVDLDEFADVGAWMGVPLIIDKRRVGMLNFNSRSVNTYTPDHAEAAEALATQTVMAIRNAQLFHQTEEALAEVETLFQVSNHLLSAGTEEELLRATVANSMERSPCVGMLFYVDDVTEKTAATITAAIVGEHPDIAVTPVGHTFPLALDLISALNFERRKQPFTQPIFFDVNTALQQPYFDESLLKELHLKDNQSKLFLPLYTDGRWVGFITITWPEPYTPAKSELRFYNIIAPQLAATLENRQLLKQTAQALAFSQSLYAASHNLINTQTKQDLLQALLDSHPLQIVDNAQLIEVNRSNRKLYGRLTARVSERDPVLPTLEGVDFLFKDYVHTQHIADGDYSIRVIHDVDQDDAPENKAIRQRMKKRGDKALIILPLLTRGRRLLGVIIMSGSTAYTISNEQAHFLQVLMPQISALLEANHLLQQTRDAQLRFEDIALNTSEGVWETQGSKVIYFSPKLADSLGYSTRETLEKPVWRMMGELFTTEGRRLLLTSVRQRKRIFEQEFKLRVKNGQATYYLMSALPVLNTKGDLTGYRGVLKDISEKKQAEQRERIAFEVGQHLTSVLSITDLFAAMTDEISAILGYHSVYIFMYEATKERLYPYYRPDTHELIWPSTFDTVQQALASRRPVLQQGKQEESQAAFPLQQGDRILGVLLVQTEQPEHFTNQEMRVFQNLSAQISVAMENARLYRELQLQAEQLEDLVATRTGEIIQERERLAAIVESAGEAIIFSRANGVIELANPAFETITGYSVAQSLGRQLLVRDMLSLLEPRQDVKEMIRTIAKGEPWRGELGFSRPNGSRFDVGLNIVPVLNTEGEVSRYVTVLHDVSAQKEVDRMRRKFVANVSHELRTPLANLKLYTTLLKSGSKEKHDRYLQIMGEQLGRLERIVEDLLDISSIDRGVMPVSFQKIKLNRLVEDVLRAHELRANERGMALRVLLSSTLPVILADPERIMQVITNLLANAINYSQEGDEIRVQTRTTRQNGRLYAALVVSDTGMGISPDDVPFIFNRFFRAETSKVMGVPGTGLGLSIVKEIVEQHNGEIIVSSFLDKGTTFTILLPTPPQA